MINPINQTNKSVNDQIVDFNKRDNNTLQSNPIASGGLDTVTISNGAKASLASQAPNAQLTQNFSELSSPTEGSNSPNNLETPPTDTRMTTNPNTSGNPQSFVPSGGTNNSNNMNSFTQQAESTFNFFTNPQFGVQQNPSVDVFA